jgi:hypothetical protein
MYWRHHADPKLYEIQSGLHRFHCIDFRSSFSFCQTACRVADKDKLGISDLRVGELTRYVNEDVQD